MFDRIKKAYSNPPVDKRLIKTLAAKEILSDERRTKLQAEIRALTALDETLYTSLCQSLIVRLVDYCQQLPQTSNRYYAQSGGLLDHALNRTEAALSLFKAFALTDSEGPLSKEQQLWQYALYSAALLQGIGKLYIEYKVKLYDMRGQFLECWNPLIDPLKNHVFYEFEFQKAGEESFRKRLNLLMARAIMPQAGFEWIASNPQVLAVWLALLNEDEQSAGALGHILIRANALALQRYYHQFLGRGQGLGRGYGRMGSFTDKSQQSLDEKEQLAGIEFIDWLEKALAEGKIELNKAPLFMIPGGMLISSEAFKWFAKENAAYTNWQAVEKGFLSLAHHQSNAQGEVYTRFEHQKSQQVITGIVMKEYAVVLPEQISVHNVNTGRSESKQALGVIQSADQSNHYVRTHTAVAAVAMQQLNAAGQWQPADKAYAGNQAGITHRG